MRFKKLLLFLALPLNLQAQDSSLVDQFQNQIQEAYKQFDEHAHSKQVVIGTLETLTAYGINRYVQKPDAKAIDSVMREIRVAQKLQTTTDFDTLIEEVRNNQANYIEIVQDNKGGIAVQNLHLKPAIAHQIQELQHKIQVHKKSEAITDKIRGYLVADLEQRITLLASDKNNYVDTSKLSRHATIINRQLNPQANSLIEFYKARQLVAITPVQKTAKIHELSQKLKVVAGQTLKGQARKGLNVLIRGAQVVLMIDVGYRIYVIASFNGDPGLFPLNDLYCRATDCADEVETFLAHSAKLYGAI